MGTRQSSDTSGPKGVVDRATLYLCRQGPRWVVVIESPGLTGALRLDHAGRSSHDARFELLSRARRACPDAAIISTDGALEDADYEWRLEVRGARSHAGDLGVALHRALAGEEPAHASARSRRWATRGCHWGLCPTASGRPRSF